MEGMNYMNLWTPLFSVMILAAVFGLGDYVAFKTKGIISGIIVAAIIYLAGFWTGIIPTTTAADTGLTTLMSSFGMALIVTHLGTLIDINDLLKEWRTVVIALTGIVGVGIIMFTIGTAVFGKEYALSAAPPITGGIVAAIIVSATATAANLPQFGAFAMLVVAFQMFVGIPITSFMLKKVAHDFLNKEPMEAKSSKELKKLSFRLIPESKSNFSSLNVGIAKIAAVACVAFWISSLTVIPGSTPTNYYLNPYVAYLLFGIIFTEIGFLEKNALNVNQTYGLFMLGTLALVPNSFATITPSALLEMIWPIVGLLLLGAIGISIFATIAGKLLRYSVPLSIALGLTAMMGYPGTYILSMECVNALDASDEDKERVKNYILPKMLVGGFTTVTVASVVFAGVIAPMIFS